MRRILLTIAFLLLGGLAAAQERAFIQIEALPSLAEATQRARFYGGRVRDLNGFELGDAWYGIALGPYAVGEARRTLGRLRAEGLIPRDSYLTAGDAYGARFWPVGGAAAPTPVAAKPDPAPAGETMRDTRRLEATLSRAEKMEVQRALRWFGVYDAVIDGAFGAGTRTSMAAWQMSVGDEATGVLTTAQRARLREAYRAGRAELGLAPVTVAAAGLSLNAPLALVAFDRIEPPFVHYAPKDDSGVRLSLISQAGGAATLAGLYEVLQTLDIVPRPGARTRGPGGFEITGVAPDRTTRARARLIDGHIVGFLLSWPERQDAAIAHALPEMERTLASVGPPLPADAGGEAGAQAVDMVSGFEVRRPLRAAAGFFVDGAGRVATAAANVEGCGRVTLDGLHEAEVALAADGIAVLEPRARLAPAEVAALATAEGRLRSAVSVGGFPYGGVLGAASLTFGTLEEVRGLDGAADVLRLRLSARAGDVGGPVLDAGGQVAGMLLPAPADDARRLPADVAFAANAAQLARVLDSAGVAPAMSGAAGAIPPEDLAARAAAMTVLVGCWE